MLRTVPALPRHRRRVRSRCMNVAVTRTIERLPGGTVIVPLLIGAGRR
jgi:hypothetical protein